MNEELKKKLKNGEVQLFFNKEIDKVDDLQNVFREAFENSILSFSGSKKYYRWYKNSICAEDNYWLNIPIIPLDMFLKKEEIIQDKYIHIYLNNELKNLNNARSLYAYTDSYIHVDKNSISICKKNTGNIVGVFNIKEFTAVTSHKL